MDTDISENVPDFAKHSYKIAISNEMWLLYAVIIILLLAKFLIAYQGWRSPWFQKITENFPISEILATMSFIIVYSFSIAGLWLLVENTPHSELPKVGYFINLFLIGLIITLIWDVIFFYLHDIQLALIVYVFLILYYLWYAYEIGKYNLVAGLFQVPMIIRTIWFFILISILATKNPHQTIL